MSRSALANVRAHLRFVSRIGHSHAVSMCACPIALTRCASGAGRRASAGASSARAAATEPDDVVARRSRRTPAASASSTSAARAALAGSTSSSLREHEHVEVQRLDVAVARPRARPGPAGRSAAPSTSGMSSGHGDVPHGGIGLAAASISRSTALAAGGRPRDDVLAVLRGAGPARGWSPSHTRPSAVNPTMPAPPRSTSADDLRPRPLGRDRRACIRNHVVSHAPPHGCADLERHVLAAARLGDADRLAVHVVRRAPSSGTHGRRRSPAARAVSAPGRSVSARASRSSSTGSKLRHRPDARS